MEIMYGEEIYTIGYAWKGRFI